MTTAREARDSGMALVTSGSTDWMYLAVMEVTRMHRNAEGIACFTGEELRLHLERLVGHPHHHNAWGALINVLQRRGLIYKNGLFKHMRTLRSHARMTPCYSFCGANAIPQSYVAMLK